MSLTRKALVSGILLLLLFPMVACNSTENSSSSSAEEKMSQPLMVGAIPDQDPEKLQRLYGKLADYLEAELAVEVEYKPVQDYTAAVSAFRVGDLELVWFGGLTGVQGRLQVKGAEAIAQRDIDAEFTTLFIASKKSNLTPLSDLQDLEKLKGRTLTFGSESSTSGRLMPQFFLQQAGITLADFKGEVGFSGSHDTTIQLVEAGTYEVGALNSQVWNDRVEAGEVDLSKVQVIWETPTYYDYHWLLHPQTQEKYGDDFAQKVQLALLKLNPENPDHQEILELFGAARFIPTQNENYAQIEKIGRKIGKIK